MDQTRVGGLPKTIEEATRRYIHYYRQNYRGPAHDEYRLANMTRAFIQILRKRAPKFYDEKLPTFVNQACSTLLLNDTTTDSGRNKFHQQHAMFLVMLQDFKRSQPSGEVNFHSELTRLQEKSDLMRKQITLQKRLEELEAHELSTDDIDEEDFDSEYTRICEEMDRVRDELQRVSFKIALLEGMETEQEPQFELHVKQKSTLSRLTVEQLRNLEKLMLEHVKANNNKKTALYMDISIIDGMLAKLDIDPDAFKKEELRHISKDALDAYKEYFRNIEMSIREENLDILCKSAHLLPKEGVIIKGPDDVPDEVKVKLEQHSKRSHTELSEIIQTYGEKPCSEDQLGDLLDDIGEEEDYRKNLIEDLRMKGIALKRVKEEPRDDCDPNELSSDQEIEVESDIAQALVDKSNIATYAPPPNDDEYIREEQPSNGANHDQSDEDQSNYEDDDDDIECLGTIEPTDKIKTFDVND